MKELTKLTKTTHMKKLTKLMTALLLVLTLAPILQSCDNDEGTGYSIGDFTPPLWATTHVTGNAFYLDCDVWGTLWPVNIDLGWYRPTEGERVITSFNPLQDDYQGYDHAVKLYTLQPVLTKQVETLTADNAEDFGDDPITIYKGDMSISGGHLNVIFLQDMPSREKHRITLVRPESDEDFIDAEGYVRLQLLYNTYDDTTPYQAFGAVSYNLKSIDEAIKTAKGVKITLNSKVNGHVEVTFNKESEDEDKTLSRREGLDISEMKMR